MPTQCQSGGQCWCVDADGKEIFGTRLYGLPKCSEFGLNCICVYFTVYSILMCHDASSASLVTVNLDFINQ